MCVVDTATAMASPTVVQSWTRVTLAISMRDKWQFLQGKGVGSIAPLVYYVLKNTRENTEGDAAVMDVGPWAP
jgi:hypothetical protein